MARIDDVTNLYDVTIEAMNAVNGYGLIHCFAEVATAIRAEPGCTGTDYFNRHPAITLWLEKLCELNGYGTDSCYGSDRYERFAQAYATCKARSLRNK